MENQVGFAQMKVARRSGQEPVHRNGQALGTTILDFWQWSSSDLVSNATRGVFAEYLVALALSQTGGVRPEWAAFDLVTASGVRVEVKSAAYLQSWYHKALSNISFGIRPTRAWSAETNAFADETRRQADIYVFAVLEHKEKSTLDPSNVDQWRFYVVRADTLNERCPTQKRIGLSSLLRLNPVVTDFSGLEAAIRLLAITG